jgi:DNA-binding transcriptional ArsR family regulator
MELAPFPTVGVLTYDAIQERDHLGTPPALKRAILSRLRRQDLDVLSVFRRTKPPPHLLGALVAPPIGFASILCGPPGAGPRFEDALERIAATPPEAFLEASKCCAAAAPDDAWSLLSADPRRWLDRYAVALRRAWTEIAPLWRRSRVLLEREVERVDAASARGVFADLIAVVHPRATVADGAWTLPASDSPCARRPSPAPYRLASRFSVCPMLTGRRATVVFSDRCGHAAALFYPTPDAGRAFEGQLPPAASLEALVGGQRALILQRLDSAATAGRIAELLDMSPGSATHHLRSLEAAGLVTRIRQGRNVVVERTARGTALVAMFDEP